MSLLLTIVKHANGISVAESSKTFDHTGGSLGRGTDNTWPLDDPERFLSSRHLEIHFDNGRYYLTDLSTNGTFMNSAPEPIGKGNQVDLAEGDLFEIGDYQFSVSIEQAAQQPFNAVNPFDDIVDPTPFDQEDVFPDPVSSSEPAWHEGNPFVQDSEPMFKEHEEMDPLAALDKAQGNLGLSSLSEAPSSSPNIGISDSFSDQSVSANQAVQWPEAVADKVQNEAIPENWQDDTHFNLNKSAPKEEPIAQEKPVAVKPVVKTSHAERVAKKAAMAGEQGGGRRRVLERANQKIQQELDELKKQASLRESISHGGSNEQLIEALGIDYKNLSDEQKNNINQLIAEFVRESVVGMMQALSSRNSLKNEFRMNVTTIQPVENNPLKFSANVDDALQNMFVKQGNAYKEPVEAIREGFESIAEHQIALLAGVRAGFQNLVERFNPEKLENRFERQNKSSIIPGVQKSKHWDAYHEYYEDLLSNSDNAFQFLFGHDFVRAYEDQLQKLLLSKKSKG